MAKYIKQEMIDLSGKGEEKVYYRLQTERNIDFKELTQQIEEHHNLMNRGLVNSVMAYVVDEMAELLGKAPEKEFVQEIEQKILSYDMVVGGFTADGYNGYLAVNVDFPDDSGTRTNTATFTVGTQYSKAIVYVDGIATVVRVAKDGTFDLNIGCGEGIFIIPIA